MANGITRFTSPVLRPDGFIGPSSVTTPLVPIRPNAMPFSPSYGVNPATLPSAVRQPAAPAPTPAAPAMTQRPAGLLGGGTTDYRSLLSDANRQAREQGLFAMLMGLGRPVPRGESRLMGALQMGQQARQAAQQSALGGISTQMKLEEMERQRAMAGRQFVPLTAEEKTRFGIPQETFAQRDVTTGEIDVSGGGGVNVSVGGEGLPGMGSLSRDFTYLRDPETNQPIMRNGLPIAVPVPGSPAAQELERTEEKEVGRREQQARAGTTVLQDLGRARNLLDELGVVTSGDNVLSATARGTLSQVPGTAENLIVQLTESALSNVGLDTLQQMRENSPTGGALGQVPIQQQKRLEQVLGSLSITQPTDVLGANIDRVMNIYTDIVYGTPTERAKLVEEGKLSREENQRIEGLYKELPFGPMGEPIDQEGQEEQVPAGVDPADWAEMTEAERALFR